MGAQRGGIGLAQYQKAYICSYEDERPNLGTRFYVQFNPAELSVDEAVGVADGEDGQERFGKLFSVGTVGWQYPAAQTLPRRQKDRLTLSATLFFNTLNDLYQDTYEDVRDYIRKLYPYTNKTAGSQREVKQIYFFWGSIAVAGVLTRLNVRYTMFAPDGRPVRAQAEITITGDYVGEACGTASAPGAAGEVMGLAKGGMALPADPSLWRTVWGKGNPRL